MSQIGNLILADGQTTPVNKTFTAKRADSQLAVWKDQSTGIPVGYPQVTLSLREQSNATNVTAILTVPTLEIISGSAAGYTPSPKVAYNCLAKMTFVLPHRSTLQERKNIRAFAKNLLLDAVASAAIENLEAPW